MIFAGAVLALLAGMAVAQEAIKSCSEAQAYCMRLCTNAEPIPPADWKCEEKRCVGLGECLGTGIYKIGTQFGHHPPNKTSFGPYEKR